MLFNIEHVVGQSDIADVNLIIVNICLQLDQMIVGEKLDSSTSKKSLYSTVEYQGYTYTVGGGCFLDPDTYTYKYKKTRKSTYKDLSSKVTKVY